MADIGEMLEERGLTLAVAESLTGGLLANHFARLPGAADWFRGGVVAYQRHVKERLLDIGDAPVVSEAAARSMAATVASRLDAGAGIAATGVGGPDPQDGIEPGTVWLAVALDGRTEAELHRFEGDPGEVCDQVCAVAERMLRAALDGSAASSRVSSRSGSGGRGRASTRSSRAGARRS